MKEPECESCPLSWEDISYEGECNACGCLLYGDGCGKLCYLPNFIKRSIAKYKQKKNDEAEARYYDGIGEWYKEEQRKDKAFREAIEKEIFHDRWGGEYYICYKGDDGQFHKFEQDWESFEMARMRYEKLLEEATT